MIKNYSIKVYLSILICLISSSFTLISNSKIPTETMDSRIEDSRKSFEDIYYELLKQNFFDIYYNNNLIINTKIDDKILKEGEVFLYLINWLSRRNDRDSYYLLKKLNKYLYLEFYRIICKIDEQKNLNSDLLHMLKDIYKIKLETPYGTRAIFRPILSKMIITIFMINATVQSYDKKREAMSYALHKIEDEFISINQCLLEKPIEDEFIKNFIKKLQTHVTKEPMVKPSIIKHATIVITTISAITGILFIVFKNSGSIKDWFSNLAGQLEDGFKTIGKGMAEGVVTEIKNQRIGEQLGRDFVSGATTNGNGQPNPDIEILANRVGTQLRTGVVGGQPIVATGRFIKNAGKKAGNVFKSILHPVETYNRIKGN